MDESPEVASGCFKRGGENNSFKFMLLKASPITFSYLSCVCKVCFPPSLSVNKTPCKIILVLQAGHFLKIVHGKIGFMLFGCSSVVLEKEEHCFQR